SGLATRLPGLLLRCGGRRRPGCEPEVALALEPAGRARERGAEVRAERLFVLGERLEDADELPVRRLPRAERLGLGPEGVPGDADLRRPIWSVAAGHGPDDDREGVAAVRPTAAGLTQRAVHRLEDIIGRLGDRRVVRRVLELGAEQPAHERVRPLDRAPRRRG